MNALDKLAYVLVVVGGLNWGLVGLFEYDLVSELLPSGLARTVFAVVGLAAVWMLVSMVKMMSAESASKSE